VLHGLSIVSIMMGKGGKAGGKEKRKKGRDLLTDVRCNGGERGKEGKK